MIGELGVASLSKPPIPSMPSIPSIPPLNLNLKSGADGNTGGGPISSDRLLFEGDWNVSTGGAPVGISQKNMIVLAAVGAGVWWLLTRKKS